MPPRAVHVSDKLIFLTLLPLMLPLACPGSPLPPHVPALRVRAYFSPCAIWEAEAKYGFSLQASLLEHGMVQTSPFSY